ncbi:MAG: hypothetical protein KDC34_18800 [Saprospiraceae bacterium]|nr:hypothetical protein [Saprospiraceae bacterium]
MPDRTKLKTGDKIRLLRVPDGDIAQREREIAQGITNPGWTANTIELIISQNPIVEIYDIDEFGQPWFTAEILVDGEAENHSMSLVDDESWELV